MLLAVVAGLMSIDGWSNLQRQWNISGEYQNVPTEQLMDWINENTSPRELAVVTVTEALVLPPRPAQPFVLSGSINE